MRGLNATVSTPHNTKLNLMKVLKFVDFKGIAAVNRRARHTKKSYSVVRKPVRLRYAFIKANQATWSV
ncbi:hypothetical protein UB33_08135 [Photobacterium angustum]|nr:hypothetical protein UB39_01660 [Photobacterium angustum]KJG06535.1 hypothetical protein UB33_08135 [Photobacterium angustum]